MDSKQIHHTIASTYDLLAQKYERAVTPVYRPLAKRLLQYIDLRPGWTVLDAGTGTGLVALLGAVRVGKTGKMIGVDASEQMLAFARAKAAQFGFTQCDFRVGDLHALEFPDACFDVALSEFALHYTDIEKSLQELHRVLQPRGALVLHLWAAESSAPHKTMWDALAPFRANEATGMLAALRAQAEKSYAFRQAYGAPDTLRGAVEQAGFANVEAHAESHPTKVVSVDAFLEIASASPALYAEISALTDESREKYLRDVRTLLKKFETTNGFEWMFNTIAVVAKK